MHGWPRRILSVFIAVAFLGGTIGVAFAFSGEACDHAAQTGTPGQHRHAADADAAACLACPCCAVVPTLPDAPAALRAPRQIAYFIKAEPLPRLTGRSVVPDPSPPRPIA